MKNSWLRPAELLQMDGTQDRGYHIPLAAQLCQLSKSRASSGVQDTLLRPVLRTSSWGATPLPKSRSVIPPPMPAEHTGFASSN